MVAPRDREVKSNLYWVGKKDDTDISKQGYIGFTSYAPGKRWNEHLHAARTGSNYPIHRAIRRYGFENLVFKVLCVGSANYCLDLERKLRPIRNIGWNIAAGGDAPGLGRKLSDEHKAAVSKAQKGRVRTERERMLVSIASKGRKPSAELRKRLSEAAKRRGFTDAHKLNISMAKKGVPSTNGAWMSPRADKPKWILSGQYYDLYNYGFGRIPSSEMLGYNGDAFKPILRRIKAGWNPWKDETFQAWKASVQEIL